jgi:LacI family transcriptional regulator
LTLRLVAFGVVQTVKSSVRPASADARADAEAAIPRVRRVALILEAQQAPRRRMLSGVARYIHEHEPWAIYLKPAGVERSLPSWLRDWHGDGIIAAVFDPETEVVTDFGIPVVDVVGVLRRASVPLVHTNDQSVGRLGAEHLLERGFHNFAFIEYPEHFWSVERRKGFQRVVEAAGFGCEVYQLPWPGPGSGGPGGWEQQQRELVGWIQRLPKPVGVMTSTDLLGQQFLEACLRANVHVPEQVAVIGADNDEPICQVSFPPLSSVIINDDQRGYQAAAVLDRMIRGEPPPKDPVYIEPAGVVGRASTDILAINDDAIVRAIRFVRERACDGIGVDDVVRQVPLSRSVLERKFRKVVGRSVNNEIVRVRLNRAVQLLCETGLELKGVAIKAGFGSTSYMSAVFREKLGRTPGSYRGLGRGSGSGGGGGKSPAIAADSLSSSEGGRRRGGGGSGSGFAREV